MSDEERRAFLLAPGRTGHLATVPADEVDAYADRNAVPGELLVRLHPETTVAVADLAGWD